MKLAVAQRQLEAAIRMKFSGEDELAIYTIAAAAHRILRDVMWKRGRNSATEAFRDGIRGVANALVAGTLSDEERTAFETTQLWPIIVALKKKIESTGDDSLVVGGGNNAEGAYWSYHSRAANFLKHADRDFDASISMNELDVDSMLAGAGMAYIQITGRPTPEIKALWIYRSVVDGKADSLPESLRPCASKLFQVDVRDRLKTCMEIVQKLKNTSAL